MSPFSDAVAFSLLHLKNDDTNSISNMRSACLEKVNDKREKTRWHEPHLAVSGAPVAEHQSL